MEGPLPSSLGKSPASTPSGCSSLIVFSGLFIWSALVASLRTVVGASLSISLTLHGSPAWAWLSLAEAALIGPPVLLAAWVWKDRRYRPAFQTWALAVVFLLFMLPVHLTAPTADQLHAILHIVLSGAFCILLLFLARRRRGRPQSGSPVHPAAWLLALLVAAIMAYPWLAWGALGSPLDTLLQLLAALAIGAAVGLLLELHLLAPLRSSAALPWQDYLLGSFSIAAALMIVASGSGFGFGGMQSLLIVVLPASAWTLMGLSQLSLAEPAGEPGAGWLLLALATGLIAAGPMTLVDPDELALAITAAPGEIVEWGLRAARTSAGIGLALAILIFLAVLGVRRPPAAEWHPRRASRWLPPAIGLAAAAAWLIAALIYARAGQPGFYGERMFVILESQADLSAAPAITDYHQRRWYVFTTLVEHARTTQADLRQQLERLNISYTPYYLVNAIEVDANPVLRAWLAARSEVDRVLDSPRLRPLPHGPPPDTGRSSNPPASPPWNLTSIGANRVWSELGITGEGIVIGQSDSGVQGDHPELAGQYRGNGGRHDYNWFDPWYGTQEPVDISGHGTHTLGSILGRQTGVAPGATWLACVNLARSMGNPGYYLDCMQFMLAPFPLGGDPFTQGDPARGAHVSNNSWGCPEIEGCDPASLRPAVQALRAAGVFTVISAGNEGPSCGTLSWPPAIYADVFSVGAVDSTGRLAAFSSIGPAEFGGQLKVKPDIIAPGVAVLSALPGDTYGIHSGTSMAGPHVAGTVALIWSANPVLIGDIDRTEQILAETARPYTQELPDCPGAQDTPSTAVGYGILDAYRAVQLALQDR